MNDLDAEKTVKWAAVIFASTWLITFSMLTGPGDSWKNINSYIPYVVLVLAEGIARVAKYHYAIAGFTLAVGLSLSNDEFFPTLKKAAAVSLYATLIPIAATLWNFLTIPGAVSVGTNSSIGEIILNFLILVISIFAGLLSSLKIWAVLAALTMLMAILIKAILALAVPFLFEGVEIEREPMQPEHFGITAALIGVCIYLLGLVPAIGFEGFQQASEADKVWKSMQSLKEGEETWLKTHRGRERVAKRIGEIESAFDNAKRNPCEANSKGQITNQLRHYFRSLRWIEDWHPNQILSEQSKRALSFAELALKDAMIDWNRLDPSVQIHLDAEEFKMVEHRFPDSCGAN